MNRSASPIVLLVALLVFLPGPVARAGGYASSEGLHSWEALVHFQLPDGSQQTVLLDDFCFVYYERLFKQTAARIGGAKSLSVSDLPREVMSVQNDKQERLRFWKIAKIRIEYRSEGPYRRPYLVAIPTSPRKKPILWPVDSLRNAGISRLPHFRGRQGGETVEVFLPPLGEEPAFGRRVLIGIDLNFVGQVRHRSWL